MDVSSNAQAAGARQQDVDVVRDAPPPNSAPTSSSRDSTLRPSSQHGEDHLEAREDAAGAAHKTGHHALNDLTHPPPSYDRGKYRELWFQIHRPKNPPRPPPASLDDAATIPLARASFFSELLYLWIQPIMTLGYQRPLQATDLWKIDEPRTADVLARRLNEAYAKRQKRAAEHNARLDAGQIKPSLLRRAVWRVRRGKVGDREAAWQQKQRQKASLLWSLSEVAGWWFWLGGLSKVIGDTSQLMGPLVSRNLIEFAQARSAADAAGTTGPNIGRGVGDAIGLLLLTISSSVFQHFFFYRSMATGVLLRAALSTVVYQRSMVLSQQARVKFNNGRLLAHLSTDISRIDYATQWIHAVWTAPIQIVICAVLLIIQIGPSALVGLALFALLVPVQSRVMSWQVAVRKKSMHWTDARSRTLQELLGSFAIIKYFVFENAYLQRIAKIRGSELLGVWKISLIKAGNQALALSLPTLAAVVSFLCYAGTGHTLNPAKIFTSLSLFQLLRQPLMFLPRALSAAADAANALDRLEEIFEAETRGDSKVVDTTMDVAIRVKNATFQWLTSEPDAAEDPTKKGKKDRHGKKKSKAKEGTESPTTRDPFKISNLSMEIGRGQLVAIVGAVGSGKSSILAGLIGEMKTLGGSVAFGGKIAYCPQNAFIQNATVRDNILFGQPWDEERYWNVMEQASLITDCLQLPDGDLTEIGERGINISGGQKQRVNVARALYFDADIVIFDDPLSALDAHIGQAIFDNAMVGALKQQGKTVLLVTHALHILPQVDYIYTVDHGTIVEQGTYQELTERKGPFSVLMQEFGGQSAAQAEERAEQEEEAISEAGEEADKSQKAKAVKKSIARAGAGSGKLEGRLIQQEKRTTGTIAFAVYRQYFSAARGWITLPLVLGSAVIMQGAQVLAGLWLVFWENDDFNQPLGFYMGLYTGIGLTQALFTFAMGACISLLTYFASAGLHARSIKKIFFAPMSLFHSTPLGRVMSVFGKDVDVLDNQLSDSLRMAAMIFGNVISSVIIVAVYFPYFLIAVAVILFGYAYFWLYYRASSRELKRLDSMLRSLLYAHFSESLSGLATIRAYSADERFKKENTDFIDLEDRAYFLTAVNQRWLSIRVDSLGALMTFAIALMAAVGVNGITPAEVGLVLSFCIGLTQAFGMVTRQTAEVENNMNAVERLTHYSSDNLPQEKAFERPETAPPKEWPHSGEIVMDAVTMSYRPNLPPVLKQLSAHIHGGEKIGIVGRTGAGKSSIMAALFRMVELSSGKIVIDGIDVSSLGLSELRSKLSIIPQEPQLFSGTIRSNLDPFSQYDDARLHDAMKRAYLLDDHVEEPEKVNTSSKANSLDHGSRFSLDTEIEDGGENLSVGERSLVSLARALVKGSKIIVLDECTASVDLETDSKIQDTITKEFKDKTLLCIAHRLRTILSYDRIMVLDAGRILEFDTPLELFRKEGGSFNAMCQASFITEADIMKAQQPQHSSHV